MTVQGFIEWLGGHGRPHDEVFLIEYGNEGDLEASPIRFVIDNDGVSLMGQSVAHTIFNSTNGMVSPGYVDEDDCVSEDGAE